MKQDEKLMTFAPGATCPSHSIVTRLFAQGPQMPLVDDLRTATARHRGGCARELAAKLDEIAQYLGVSKAETGTDPVATFRAWFQERLVEAGVEPRYVTRLVDAATPIVITSSVLAAIARASWLESSTHVGGMDAFVTGSVARSEACPVSDYDFDFLARDDAELIMNGLPASAQVTTKVENERTRVMARSKWYESFRESAAARGFIMTGHHLAYVLTVDELDATRLAMTLGFERYATNYLSSTAALRHSERWALAEPLLIAGLTVARALDQKTNLVRGYFGQLQAGPRPHTAHGVLSQTWQAIMYAVFGVTKARLPYWALPLLVPLDRRAQRQWVLAFTALARYRLGEDRTIAVYAVSRALIEVIRCCRALGADPTSLAELDAVFTL